MYNTSALNEEKMLIVTFGTLTNYCTSERCYKRDRELGENEGGRGVREMWGGGSGLKRVQRKNTESILVKLK